MLSRNFKSFARDDRSAVQALGPGSVSDQTSGPRSELVGKNNGRLCSMASGPNRGEKWNAVDELQPERVKRE